MEYFFHHHLHHHRWKEIRWNTFFIIIIIMITNQSILDLKNHLGTFYFTLMTDRQTDRQTDTFIPREARLINQSGRRPERSESRAHSSEKYIYIHISMKVSVLLPGNSGNTVCLTSEKGKVARQQQVVRQAGVRGNLQLLCNWSKVARTGNYKR